ncbi:MAG: FFLEELY motif protein [Chloroflexota bacterium]
MPEPAPKSFMQILLDLQKQEDARRQAIAVAGLTGQLERLRRWQSERLQRTYRDLLGNSQYRQACEFFLSDIYAASDFSQRDHDAERMYSMLTRYLPETMLQLLGDTLYLNRLTYRLDDELLQALVERLGVTEEIDAAAYAEGYRLCDNYAERRKQIDLLGAVLDEAARGAHYPMVAMSIKLARGPAYKLGWGELHSFMERGYQASRPMRDIDHFVKTIKQRELRILDKIYAGDPEPFRV